MTAHMIVDNGISKYNELKQFKLSSHYIGDINCQQKLKVY